MSDKVPSYLEGIPAGSASEKITEGCLVLEGGAFRGLYTQGFLDAMMTNDINLGCVIGVSAGALGGMNYLSGQIGRSARINLGYRHDSRYIGPKAILHSHSILDVGFLTEERGILEPFDRERFMEPGRRFVAVATNCLTGKPAFLEKGQCSDIMKAARASATLPYISPAVEIDRIPYFDGGCSCMIPYQWALDQGYKKVVVIKTRDAHFRKEAKGSHGHHSFYRQYPAFTAALDRSEDVYNRQCREVEELHREGKLLRFAPSVPVTVSRLESDLEKLRELYDLGWRDCMKGLEELRSYLTA